MLVTILIAGGALVTTGLVAVISDYMRENRELRDIIANRGDAVMLGALVIVGIILLFALYAIGQLLHENTRLRSHIEEQAKKLAKWQEYNDRNKATAQAILDRVAEEQAKRFAADEDLRICSMELRTTENLLTRKNRRYSTGIL